MSYEIRIRGHREPTLVENNGEKLRLDWEEYQLNKTDKIVEVGSWVGKLSMIQDFKKTPSSNSNNNKSSEDPHKEYTTERNKILSMSTEERANRMGFFRLMYWGFTHKNSEDVNTLSGKSIEEFAKEIQLKFFTENPKRTLCNPILFKPLIKSEKIVGKLMPTVEQLIRQDIYMTK